MDLPTVAERVASACRDLLHVSLYAQTADLTPDQEEIRRRFRSYLKQAGSTGPTRADCLHRVRREVVQAILQEELSK